MNQLGVALIGAGNIAQNFHIPFLSTLKNVELRVVCDRNRSKAKILAERYSIPHYCRSLEEMLAYDNIDAVLVCTSTDGHQEIAEACMERGLDVFIEKPISRSAREAKSIVETADRLGRKLMVGMNHRFRSDIVLLKDKVMRGELGELFYMKSGWLSQRSNQRRWLEEADRAGGGVLLDLGIVLLDIMLWMFNYAEVHSVRAATHYHETKNVEDFVTAFINFRDDRVATMEASWSLMRPDEVYYCNIFGTKGSAYANPLKVIKRVGSEFSVEMNPLQGLTRKNVIRKSYHTELQHFLNAVRGLVPTVSTGREAYERMRIIEAMYVSARERTEVILID